MKKKVIVSVAIACMMTLSVAFPASAGAAEPDYLDSSQLTDSYVLGNSYIDPHGKTITSENGLQTFSGDVPLSPNDKQLRASTVYRWGSSYASTVESVQFFYTGKAYASGKQDYQDPMSPWMKKRVVEVCFKYTRDGKDLISWQCSRASLGPLFSPGKEVSKTVTDNLSLTGPKTTFRYSFKVA